MEPQENNAPDSTNSSFFPGYAAYFGLPHDRLWQGYMLYSFLTFLTLVSGLASWTLVKRIWRKRQSREYQSVNSGRPSMENEPTPDEPHWSAETKRVIAELVSGQRTSGKVLTIVEFAAGIVAFIAYLKRASDSSEQSKNWYYHHDWAIDLACHLFLCVVSILRFIADNHKLQFLFSLFAFVDYCTIPTAILSFICYDHVWLGLRFLRAFHILTIPDILQICVKSISRTTVRLSQLVCILFSVLLVGSGVFHMLEEPDAGRSFWAYVYFSIITLSTVGYGDISPASATGRLFCCIFIFSALALFATSIPELAAIIASRKKYSKSYEPDAGTAHVVISGFITTTSMETILEDFALKYGRKDVKLVFVHNAEPDLDMEAVIKRNFSKLVFIQGDLLDLKGLRKARVSSALACLFVADPGSRNPDEDDRTTVVGVASVKTHSPRTRCIVQLLQGPAKTALLNIPSFNLKSGDCVLCFHEMVLALMAKNCLAPGAGTLISNMIRSPTANLRSPDNDPVMAEYLRGSHMEITLERFSSHFYGMNFMDAVRFAFTKLEVLLIGLYKPERSDGPSIVLCPSQDTITPGGIGIFVATSHVAIHRVKNYCDKCHCDVKDHKMITKCSCRGGATYKASVIRDPFERLLSLTEVSKMKRAQRNIRDPPPAGWEKRLNEEIRGIAEFSRRAVGSEEELARLRTSNLLVDSSGAFYWNHGRSFQEALIDHGQALNMSLSNHVIALVLAQPNDPKINLIDFVLPMRSSRIPLDQIKDIIFVGNASYLESEWTDIADLPRIYVVDGDPFNRAALRAVGIKDSSMCVILSAWTGSGNNAVLDDRDLVLAALNIKAMPFEEMDDEGHVATYYGVPLMAELQHDANMRLLDTSPDDAEEYEDLCLAQPYMCGEVVSFRALDSLFVASFVNPIAVPIITHLLYGFRSTQMEEFLAEGVGLIAGPEYSTDAVSPYSTRIELVPVSQFMKARETEAMDYNSVVGAAAEFGQICLGIGRAIAMDQLELRHKPKRCVITNPNGSFHVQADDLVYVLTK